jgi:hypothetical protein
VKRTSTNFHIDNSSLTAEQLRVAAEIARAIGYALAQYARTRMTPERIKEAMDLLPHGLAMALEAHQSSMGALDAKYGDVTASPPAEA